MKNNNPHMLDTNILLGMILPNDNSYKSAEKYLKTTYLRYISETSCKEAENKILNIQKLSLDISEFLKIYSINNNINYLNIPKIKSQVKKEFINKFKNDPLPIPKNRFKKLVFDFFDNYETEITSVLINAKNQ